MRAPMILTWVAKKAGISDELALKLWRRAAGEAELLTGNTDTSDYYRSAVEHFLNLAEEESLSIPCQLAPAPRLTWVWRHQGSLSRLSMLAGENAYRQWQSAMQKYYRVRKAA